MVEGNISPVSSVVDVVRKEYDASHEEVAEQKDQHGDEALKILGSHVELITEEEERKVLRKIDWRLIPVMMLVNSVQLIDKNVCDMNLH